MDDMRPSIFLSTTIGFLMVLAVPEAAEAAKQGGAVKAQTRVTQRVKANAKGLLGRVGDRVKGNGFARRAAKSTTKMAAAPRKPSKTRAPRGRAVRSQVRDRVTATRKTVTVDRALDTFFKFSFGALKFSGAMTFGVAVASGKLVEIAAAGAFVAMAYLTLPVMRLTAQMTRAYVDRRAKQEIEIPRAPAGRRS
jgi:hypothetical protein